MIDVIRYQGLTEVKGFRRPVYVSDDLQQSARQIAKRFSDAYGFLSDLLAATPDIGLVVLSEADWPHYAGLPIFGVTHYDYPHRMVVTAAEPSTFWHPLIDRIAAASPKLLKELRAIYGRAHGAIDLTPQIDLWICHDLGHAFHLAKSYWFPRHWLMEYFADLCAYSYIGSKEPEQLPTLMTLYHVLRAMDAREYSYHTLVEFEAHYDAGDWHTDNYLWYHGRLFTAAEKSYQAVGVEVVRRMWKAFVDEDVRDVSHTELLNLLHQAQPELAKLVVDWTR